MPKYTEEQMEKRRQYQLEYEMRHRAIIKEEARQRAFEYRLKKRQEKEQGKTI